MKPKIYVDASALPFAALVQWARDHGYHCQQDGCGRAYFVEQPKPRGVTDQEFAEVYGDE